MNIFRQAKQLIDTKRGDEMTEEELELIATAIIPLMVKTNGIFPDDITIGEGLEELAKMMEVEFVRHTSEGEEEERSQIQREK